MNSQISLSRIAGGFAIAVLLTACAASQYKQTEQQIAQQPINCATAEGDIRMLQNEKASVAKQIAMGVTAIVPVGLVAGVATGTEKTKYQVATGEYNRMIDQKIAEIKAFCGL